MDIGGFATAKTEPAVSAQDFDRVAERGHGQHFDFFPVEQTQLQESLHKGGFTFQAFDHAALSDA